MQGEIGEPDLSLLGDRCVLIGTAGAVKDFEVDGDTRGEQAQPPPGAPARLARRAG